MDGLYKCIYTYTNIQIRYICIYSDGKIVILYNNNDDIQMIEMMMMLSVANIIYIHIYTLHTYIQGGQKMRAMFVPKVNVRTVFIDVHVKLSNVDLYVYMHTYTIYHIQYYDVQKYRIYLTRCKIKRRKNWKI